MKLEKSRLSLFVNNESGVVWVMVAILVPVMFAILFLSLNFSTTQSSYSNNQGAVDATALAVAELILQEKIKEGTITPERYNASALEIYKSNFGQDQSIAENIEFEVTIDNTSVNNASVKIYACAEIKNNLNAAAGVENADKSKVCNVASASIPNISKVEIALALDVTSSMLQDSGVPGLKKIEALKQALIGDGDNIGGLLNSEVVRQAEKTGSVFWAVVPFRGMVDLGNNAMNIVANDWDGRADPGPTIIPKEASILPDGTYARNSDASVQIRSAEKEYNFLTRMNVSYAEWKKLTPGAAAKSLNLVYGGSADGTSFTPNDPNGVERYFHDEADNLLIRVPLTERVSGNNSLRLDERPEGDNKFKAYWHHPRQYWYGFLTGAWQGAMPGESPYTCVWNGGCPWGSAPSNPQAGDGNSND